MEIPKWSGDSHRFARYRIRVFWFRLLLASALVASGFALSTVLGNIKLGDSESVDSGHGHDHSSIPDFPSRPDLLEVGSIEIVGVEPRESDVLSEKVLAVLSSTRSPFHLDETPFNDFLELVRIKSGQNVLVTEAAQDIIDGESLEFTFSSSDISLKSVLGLSMIGRDISYRVKSGIIHIESKEENTEPLLSHSYDVREVLYLAAKRRHDQSDTCRPTSRPCCFGEEEADISEAQSDCTCGILSSEILIEFLMKACVDEDDDGSMELTKGLLIVRQDLKTHKKIERTLRTLVSGMKAKFPSPDAPAVVECERLTPFDFDCDRRLAKKVNLDFNETPLIEMLKFLSEVSGVPIFISPSVDSEELTVSLNVKSMAIEQVLTFLTEDHGLAMYRTHESLVFTLKEHTEEYNQYYSDLHTVSALLEPRSGSEPLDADYLTEMLRNSTGEDHWEEPAEIEVIFGQLYVRQTTAVHRVLLKTLNELRQADVRSRKP